MSRRARTVLLLYIGVLLSLSAWSEVTEVSKKGEIDSTFLADFREFEQFGVTIVLDASEAVFPNDEVPAGAFLNCTHLYGIKLPPTIRRIGASAFENTGLLTIELPSELEELGAGAFRGCFQLSGTLHLPKKLRKMGTINRLKQEYVPGSFEGCVSLDSVVFHHGAKVDTIGEMTFGYCMNLKGEVILDKVKAVGAGAFTHTSLSRIEIGGLVYIGGYTKGTLRFEGAFEGSKAKEVYVEDDDMGELTEIDLRVFKGLPSQSSVTLLLEAETDVYPKIYEGEENLNGQDLSYWSQVGLTYSDIFEKNQTVRLLRGHIIVLSQEGTLLTELGRFSSVKYPVGRLTLVGGIRGNELSQLRVEVPQLRSLHLSGSLLREIPSGAFGGGSSLRRIVFPQVLKTIGSNAFGGVSLQGTLRLPTSVERIEDGENGKGAFAGQDGVRDIVFPPMQADGKDSVGYNLRKIGNYTFMNMRGLVDTIHIKPNYWVSTSRSAFVGTKVAVDYFEIESSRLLHEANITLTDPSEPQCTVRVEIKPYYFTGDLTVEVSDATTGKVSTQVKIDSAGSVLKRDSLNNTAEYRCALTLDNRGTHRSNYKIYYQGGGGRREIAQGSVGFQYTKADNVRFVVEGKESEEEDVTLEVGETYKVRAVVKPSTITFPELKWSSVGADWVTESKNFEFIGKETVIKEIDAVVFVREVRIRGYGETVYVGVTTPDGAAGSRLTLRTKGYSLGGFELREEKSGHNPCVAEAGDTVRLRVGVPGMPEGELPEVTWSIRTGDDEKDSYAGLFLTKGNSACQVVIPRTMGDTLFRVKASVSRIDSKGDEEKRTASVAVRVTKLFKKLSVTVNGEEERGSFSEGEVITVRAKVEPGGVLLDDLDWKVGGTTLNVLEDLGSVVEVKGQGETTYRRQYKVLRIDRSASIVVTAKIASEKVSATYYVLASKPEGYPYNLWMEHYREGTADWGPLNTSFLSLQENQSVKLRAQMSPWEALPQWNVYPTGVVSYEVSGDGLDITIRARKRIEPSLESRYVYVTVTVSSGPNGATIQQMQTIKISHVPINKLYIAVQKAPNEPVTGIGEHPYDKMSGGIGVIGKLEPGVGASYPEYQWSIHPKGYARFTSGWDINNGTDALRWIEALLPNREFTVSVRPVVDTSLVKGYSYTIRIGRSAHYGHIIDEEADTIYLKRHEEKDLTVYSPVPEDLKDREDLRATDFYPMTWRLSAPAVGYFVGNPKAEIVTYEEVKYIKYTHRFHAFLSDTSTYVIVRDSTQSEGGDTLYVSTHTLPQAKTEVTVSSEVEAVAVEKIAIVTGGATVSEVVLAPSATVKLQAKLSPEEATYTDVQWIVENPSVAVIEEGGSLRSLSSGGSCSLKVLRHDASTRVIAISLDAAAPGALLTDTLTVRTTPSPLPAEEPTEPVAPEEPTEPESPAEPEEPESPIEPEEPAEPEVPVEPEEPTEPVEPEVPSEVAPTFEYTIIPKKEILDVGDTVTVTVEANPVTDYPLSWTVLPSSSAHFVPTHLANPMSRSFRVDGSNTTITLFVSTDTFFTFVVGAYVPVIPQRPEITVPPAPPLSNGEPSVMGGAPGASYHASMLRLTNLEGYHVVLSGISGRIVYSEGALISSDEYRYLRVPTGIYILSALKEGKRETIKVVVE
ncbi:MAG: leucine-rich repeat domain-containing protein [Tannerellaceae bacterium]|jgi:hypothetical protein|nr:leucine-rich repeat domain-containing protein [Tannerellaceae bacterium]